MLKIKQVSKTLQLKNLYPLPSQDFPPPTHVARTLIENKSSLLQITFISIWEDVKFSIKINISRPRLIISQHFPLSFHFSLSPWLTLHYLLGVGVTTTPNPPPCTSLLSMSLNFRSFPFQPLAYPTCLGLELQHIQIPPPFFIDMCLNFRCLH